MRWLRHSLGMFWNRYVKAAGFRDGVPGLVAAALLSAYVFVEQAKVWETQHVKDAAAGDPGADSR